MATIARSFVLNGPKEFFFPFPVRFPSHVRLDIDGAGQVPDNDFEVIGAGASSVSVTVKYPNAPADGTILTVSRIIPVERVTDFPDDEPVTATRLNAEFDNVYQLLEQLL